MNYRDIEIHKEDICTVVKKLKWDKQDGNRELFSNHILHGSDNLLKLIASLFTAITVHGHHPDKMRIATIHSIPKDSKGNLCEAANYRGIALISAVSKLYDLVFLKRNIDKMKSSELQYAFKEKHGTSMCTLVVKEVIHHYIKNKSNVAACLIDASKAFDRVRHDRLFGLLVERKINSADIRALLDLYQRQLTRTEWKGQYSDTFTSANGIRQGSITSPLLYCLYMDELLVRLKKSGIGCWIGAHYLGAISYADDLTLLSPSHNGLQEMIKTCEEYAVEFGVEFNPIKSVCVLFGKGSTPKISLGGRDLKWVKTVKFLGNHLTSELSETEDVRLKRGDLVGRVNSLVGNLGDAPDAILLQIFRSECCHFYGTQCWDFTQNSTRSFHTMWNQCVRRLLKLPMMTHSQYLELLVNQASSTVQVAQRFARMCQSMIDNDNNDTGYLVKIGLSSADTIIGRNMRWIGRQMGKSTQELMRKNCKLTDSSSKEDHWAVKTIQELRKCQCGPLNDYERLCLLQDLCTS